MLTSYFKELNVDNTFHKNDEIVIHRGDCLDLLKQIPDEFMQLVVTSPPYNIGKEYEKKIKLR